MTFPPITAVVLLLSIFLIISPVQAAPRNISIDHRDPRIAYEGQWTVAPGGTRGGHTESLTSAATAAFRFEGTTVHYVAPKFPYPVSVYIGILEENMVIFVDLQDYDSPARAGGPPSLASAVVASIRRLPNSVYTLTVTPGPDSPFAVMDEIIYTVEHGMDSSAISSLSLPSTQSLTPVSAASASPVNTSLSSDGVVLPLPSSTSSVDRTASDPAPSTGGPDAQESEGQEASFPLPLAAGLGASAGMVVLLTIYGFYWLIRRRQVLKKAEDDRNNESLASIVDPLLFATDGPGEDIAPTPLPRARLSLRSYFFTPPPSARQSVVRCDMELGLGLRLGHQRSRASLEGRCGGHCVADDGRFTLAPPERAMRPQWERAGPSRPLSRASSVPPSYESVMPDHSHSDFDPKARRYGRIFTVVS